MATPWSWLNFRSSPPKGLFDNVMERESTFLGILSSIYGMVEELSVGTQCQDVSYP